MTTTTDRHAETLESARAWYNGQPAKATGEMAQKLHAKTMIDLAHEAAWLASDAKDVNGYEAWANVWYSALDVIRGRGDYETLLSDVGYALSEH